MAGVDGKGRHVTRKRACRKRDTERCMLTMQDTSQDAVVITGFGPSKPIPGERERMAGVQWQGQIRNWCTLL